MVEAVSHAEETETDDSVRWTAMTVKSTLV